MVRRRREPSETLDYNRVMAKVEEGFNTLTNRMEQLAEGQDQRMARIERDVAAGEQHRTRVLAEVAEGRLENGELRDSIRKLRDDYAKTSATEGARVAEGAARGAAVAVQEGLAVTFAKGAGLKRWQKWLIGGGALALFVELGDRGPAVAKFMLGLPAWLGATVVSFMKYLASLA